MREARLHFGLMLTLALAVLLPGCADPDAVLFVTKSSLGIDFDAKPPSATIAYDRVEGYVAPRYDNGAVPPVIASIRTDGSLVNPEIRQIYATGQAALNAVQATGADTTVAAKPLSGGKRLMFFGTSTTTGLKVSFGTDLPDSLTFGYKRKEFSYIPVGHTTDASGNQIDTYPSVIASLDTRADALSPADTGLATKQFFATGAAADRLAQEATIRSAFSTEATTAYAKYAKAVREQEQKALVVLRCFAGVQDGQLLMVWKDANFRNLYQGAADFQELQKVWTDSQSPSNASRKPDLLRQGRRLYAANIGITIGSTPDRAAAMDDHSNFVCGLARAGNG